MHFLLAHLTSRPAAFFGMKPGVSHIGHSTFNRRPFIGLEAAWIAVADFAGGFSNGLSSGCFGFGRALGFGLGSAFFGLDEAGFVAPGFPLIDAPQNGHSVASSSRTDCLQAGQVGNIAGVHQAR